MKYKVGDKVKIYIHNMKVKDVEIVRATRFLWINMYLFLGIFDGHLTAQWYSEKHIIARSEKEKKI